MKKESLLIMILIAMFSFLGNTVFSQTTRLTFTSMPPNPNVMVDGVPYTEYRATLATFVTRLVLISSASTMETYKVDYSLYNLEGEKLQDFKNNIREQSLYDINLTTDQKGLIITIDRNKTSPTDLVHEVLWKKGFRQ